MPGPQHIPALQAIVDLPEPPTATDDEIDAVIAALIVALPRRREDGGAAAAKAELYAQHLSDLTGPDLAEGCARLIREAKFFPTVSEIRAAAAWPKAQRLYRRSRAMILIRRHRDEWVDPTDTVDVTDMRDAAIAKFRSASC